MDQYLVSELSVAAELESCNHRKGHNRKMVLSGYGSCSCGFRAIAQTGFGPRLIAKYRWRLSASDEKIVSHYARGLTVREAVILDSCQPAECSCD